MVGRTSLVIAHRVSTVIRADRILVLDGGRIVADGGHDDLLRDSPLYGEIVDSQLPNRRTADVGAGMRRPGMMALGAEERPGRRGSRAAADVVVPEGHAAGDRWSPCGGHDRGGAHGGRPRHHRGGHRLGGDRRRHQAAHRVDDRPACHLPPALRHQPQPGAAAGKDRPKADETLPDADLHFPAETRSAVLPPARHRRSDEPVGERRPDPRRDAFSRRSQPDDRRSLRADRHLRRHAHRGMEAGAGHVHRGPPYHRRGADLLPTGPSLFPLHPADDRRRQRESAGRPCRGTGDPGLQSRRRDHRALSGVERGQPRCEHHCGRHHQRVHARPRPPGHAWRWPWWPPLEATSLSRNLPRPASAWSSPSLPTCSCSSDRCNSSRCSTRSCSPLWRRPRGSSTWWTSSPRWSIGPGP